VWCIWHHHSAYTVAIYWHQYPWMYYIYVLICTMWYVTDCYSVFIVRITGLWLAFTTYIYMSTLLTYDDIYRYIYMYIRVYAWLHFQFAFCLRTWYMVGYVNGPKDNKILLYGKCIQQHAQWMYICTGSVDFTSFAYRTRTKASVICVLSSFLNT
jgi:hypothetical protein